MLPEWVTASASRWCARRLGTFRYNSIGSFVKGGAYRTYGWVDPAKDLVGIIFMQRTNGGGDVADEINSFMAMAAAAIEN